MAPSGRFLSSILTTGERDAVVGEVDSGMGRPGAGAAHEMVDVNVVGSSVAIVDEK